MNHTLTFEELHKALKGKFAIISAENPNAEKQSDDLNKLATSALKLRLTNDRFIFTEVVGMYAGNTEHSFLVMDMEESTALAYAEFYRQESVLTDRGLLTPNGDVLAERNIADEYIASGMTLPEDNYSLVNTLDAGVVTVSIGLTWPETAQS